MRPRDARRHRALDRMRLRADVEISGHARKRLAEHGFSEGDVLEVVLSPEQTYTCCQDRYGPDRRMHQRGPLAVVIDTRLRLIVTVLPRTQERCEHATTR